VARSAPQLITVLAGLVGVVLFAITLSRLELASTLGSVRRLGVWLPIVLLPGAAWHVLRTWGWLISFPDDTRPGFSRLFRVRLAADAISFFTVRGITGEPLKVLLLYGEVEPKVAAAAIALERLAIAVISVVVAGVVSTLAVRRLAMPGAWNVLFSLLAAGAVFALASLALVVRRRTGDYVGRLVAHLERLSGRRLEASRAIRFVLDVEDVLLELLRGSRRRLLLLTVIPLICYALTATEVLLVLWVVGEPIGFTAALAVDTFARLGSVASAFIPANVGALEAANVAPVAMLGLAGGGALALVRRIKALLWAGLGLVLYPRVGLPVSRS
jgi:hypothetical protein